MVLFLDIQFVADRKKLVVTSALPTLQIITSITGRMKQAEYLNTRPD